MSDELTTNSVNSDDTIKSNKVNCLLLQWASTQPILPSDYVSDGQTEQVLELLDKTGSNLCVITIVFANTNYNYFSTLIMATNTEQIKLLDTNDGTVQS